MRKFNISKTMRIKHLFLALAMLTCAATANAQSTTGEKVKAFADQYLKLSGYIQGGFSWDEYSQSTFYLKRARVSLTGDAAKEKIDYRLQVDMAGSPKICDLYFRYKPLKELNFELGQFKVPFALENELCGPTTFEFIEYSYITTYLNRNHGLYDGIASTGRDIGFQLYGGFIQRDGFSIINYNLGVFNGAGINVKDNNFSKDFVARLTIKPIEDLSISGSYMYAESAIDQQKYVKAPRWSVGAWYNSSSWLARAEYAEAYYKNGGALGTNKVNSFYVLAGYDFDDTFDAPWTFVARYEFIDDSYNTLANDRTTFGVAYKPFRFLRLQLNLSYESGYQTKTGYRNIGANLMATAIF